MKDKTIERWHVCHLCIRVCMNIPILCVQVLEATTLMHLGVVSGSALLKHSFISSAPAAALQEEAAHAPAPASTSLSPPLSLDHFLSRALSPYPTISLPPFLFLRFSLNVSLCLSLLCSRFLCYFLSLLSPISLCLSVSLSHSLARTWALSRVAAAILKGKNTSPYGNEL